MKVCTDACLFGSIVAEKFKSENSKVKSVLDIGTGTGLLALMLAQKNEHAVIDAVEIDEQSAMQAQENFEASGWKERLNVHHSFVQQFSETENNLYDLIISNPPFFENDLKSNDDKRNLALHSAELSLQELVSIADKQLSADGTFGVLLPYHRTDYFIGLAKANNLFLREKIVVRQTAAHNYFRSILFFTRSKSENAGNEITIQQADGKYTREFISLLKDYYLYL